MDASLLRELDRLVRMRAFPNRSEAIRQAVSEQVRRADKRVLARECAKLDRKSEQAFADEGLSADSASWPEY